MPLFGTKAVTLTRNEFYALVQSTTGYTQLSAVIGPVAVSYLLGILFEDNLRMVQNGLWFAGAAVNRALPVLPNSTIKLKDKTDLAALKNRADLLLDGDRIKINNRQIYVTQLMLKAQAGTLRTEMLAGKTEPEATYFTAPPVQAPRPGAPAIPAKAAWLVNMDKAICWASHGAPGGAGAYSTLVQRHTKRDGTFPLGGDEKLVMALWKDLVTGAPPYRSINPATPYPSSVGGLHLLKWIFQQTRATAWPAYGSQRWINWALFFYAGMMTVQGFSDGNKRVCRCSYALIMASAGIDFKAPTPAYGAILAAMT